VEAWTSSALAEGRVASAATALLLQLPQGLLLVAQRLAGRVVGQRRWCGQATGDAEGGNVAREERHGSTPQRLYGLRTCLRGC